MTKFTKLLVAGCAAAALWATGASAAIYNAADMKPVNIKPGTYKGKTAAGKEVEVVMGSSGVTSIKVGGSNIAMRPGTWTNNGWWVATDPTVKNTGAPPNKYVVRAFTDNSIIYASGWTQRFPGDNQAQLWWVK